MRAKFDLKDLGVAFSLGNLWFVTFWKKFFYAPDNHYLAFKAHTGSEYLSVFIDVIFLSGVFFALMRFSNSAPSPWLKRAAQSVFIVLGVCAFGALSAEIIKWLSPKTINFVNLPLPLFVLCFCLALSAREGFRLDKITANLKLIPLLLLPFSLLIFLQLFWVKFVEDPKNLLPEAVERGVPEGLSPRLSKKVVWVIFDNSDYAALTASIENSRPRLPDVVLLMNQSFVAQNAYPPNHLTLRSIPALFTGKPLRAVVPVAANDLRLHPKDNSAPFSWRESDNIISEVDRMGGTVAVVGWCHPYPRIFEEKISYGYWHSVMSPPCRGPSGVAGCAVNNFIDSLHSIPFAARLFPSLWTTDLILPSDDREQQIARNVFLTGKARALIADPELNLLFFHFSEPHPPYIGRHDLGGRESYFDSLEVMNDTIRGLRERLEEAGQWDATTFIVSSDHWWRRKTPEDFSFLPEDRRPSAVADTRIPFMVKLPGQRNKIEYAPPFNTLITKELILAIFKDQIKNTGDLTRWMEQMRIDRPEIVNPPVHKPGFPGPEEDSF